MEFSFFKTYQTKQLRYILYLLLVLILGFSFWSLNIEEKKKNPNIDLSSLAKKQNHMQLNEIKAIQKLSFQETAMLKKELPRRFSANPAFKLFAYVQNFMKERDHKDRAPASNKQ